MEGHSNAGTYTDNPPLYRLGKEIGVLLERLEEQMRLLFNIPFAAKFGGATGNYNAHHVAIHKSTGENLEEPFEENLGLHHSFPTNRTLRSLCSIF
jgi:adenylosuccinate lyase